MYPPEHFPDVGRVYYRRVEVGVVTDSCRQVHCGIFLQHQRSIKEFIGYQKTFLRIRKIYEYFLRSSWSPDKTGFSGDKMSVKVFLASVHALRPNPINLFNVCCKVIEIIISRVR